MKRIWILLLALSLGLNAALLYVAITGHPPGKPPREENRSWQRHRDMLHRFMEEHARGDVGPDGRPLPGFGHGHGPGQGPGPGMGPGPEGGPGEPGGPPGAEGPPVGAFSDSLRQMRLHFMKRMLNLSPEQREELDRILDANMPGILEARAGLFDLRRAVYEEMQEPEVDEAKVRGLVHDMGRAQSRLDSLIAETILQEALHLDPEQREAYFRAMPWHDHMPRAGQPGGRGSLGRRRGSRRD